MRAKRRHITVLLALVTVIAAVTIGSLLVDAYWNARSREVFAGEHLIMPGDKRALLTNGTTDGVAWLERQLKEEDGRLVALYILNSMLVQPIDDLPEPMPKMGFCGNTPRSQRRRYARAVVQRTLSEWDEAIADYFSATRKHEFRPLRTVDWSDPRAVEETFLSSIESRDLGMLALCMQYRADAGSYPRGGVYDSGRIRFHRNNGTYDLRKTARSDKRIIPFDVVDGRGTVLGAYRNQLTFELEDCGDGTYGVWNARFGQEYNTMPTTPVEQPVAPSDAESASDSGKSIDES